MLGHLGFTLIAGRLLRPFAWTGQRFPVHLLLLGALLPDIIDKPLGHGILGWDNGRLWAHTLLFVLALGAWAWMRASPRLGALALGAGLHQLQDQLPWGDPASWLWPLGGAFPRGLSPGLPDWIAALTSDPYIWASEGIGLLALIVLIGLPSLGLGRQWWHRPAGGKAPVIPVADTTSDEAS